MSFVGPDADNRPLLVRAHDCVPTLPGTNNLVQTHRFAS